MVNDLINNGYKSAIVTGGAGFIGSHICDYLVENGVNVKCIDNLINGKLDNINHLITKENFSFHEVDILDFKNLLPLFVGVDIVFNEACSKNTVSLEDPRLDLEVNILGTYNVLEASRLNHVKKVVHASSGSVFGEPIKLPEDENHPLNPVSFYGTSKLAGEKYCFAFKSLYGLNVTSLRYFHVYGPRQDDSDKGGVVSIFSRKLIKNERPTIYGDGTQLRSFTYVKDVVNANIFCALDKSTDGEVYIVASGLKITVFELYKKIKNILNIKDLEPIFQDWKPGDIKVFDISNKKLRSLGFEFKYSFDEGLDETVKWIGDKYNG